MLIQEVSEIRFGVAGGWLKICMLYHNLVTIYTNTAKIFIANADFLQKWDIPIGTSENIICGWFSQAWSFCGSVKVFCIWIV